MLIKTGCGSKYGLRKFLNLKDGPEGERIVVSEAVYLDNN